MMQQANKPMMPQQAMPMKGPAQMAPMPAQPAQMGGPQMAKPVAEMQSSSMAQQQVQAMSPQLPGGAQGVGKFQSNYSQGKMDSGRKFQAMQNLVGGKYKF